MSPPEPSKDGGATVADAQTVSSVSANVDVHDDPMVAHSLADLIAKVRAHFKAGGHIAGIVRLVESYPGDPKEWTPYAFENKECYTRNLIAHGDEFDLMIVCWYKSQSSRIHDHGGSHCIMRCLSGEVFETQYEPPKYGDDYSQLTVRCDGSLKDGQIRYINDTIAVHKIGNKLADRNTYSIHLYSPPVRHCHIFRDDTGEPIPRTVDFFTDNCEEVKSKFQLCGEE